MGNDVRRQFGDDVLFDEERGGDEIVTYQHPPPTVDQQLHTALCHLRVAMRRLSLAQADLVDRHVAEVGTLFDDLGTLHGFLDDVVTEITHHLDGGDDARREAGGRSSDSSDQA